MGLLETVFIIWEKAETVASGISEIRDYLKSKVKLEQVLSDLVQDKFNQQLPRLKHLCPDGIPVFDKNAFVKTISETEIRVETADALVVKLVPLLSNAVSRPGSPYGDDDFLPVFESILRAAVRGMWKKISQFEAPSNEVIMNQNEQLIRSQEKQQGDLTKMKDELVDIRQGVEKLRKFAETAFTQVYDKLFDAAPPKEHTIDKEVYVNPFLLAKAEDFNHNYEKLARLFQDSPEWDSIQRRTDNVFIEGGRGTGKSMLLRRLTAPATLSAARLENRAATFDDVRVDYFGVYVKLTRGYYEQFEDINSVSPYAARMLAQHELNIEIFDAFVDTIGWLVREGALPKLGLQMELIAKELSGLFGKAPAGQTLEQLQKQTVKFEQDQITEFIRDKTFDKGTEYSGSASDTVSFLRKLSELFKQHFFPEREMRLFLLVDEFETLIETQQVALNTVMKMRLPDLSLKVAVRKSGRKTASTFTPGDPIQQPRDYVEVRLDYDVALSQYSALLHGIASKRLQDAGYKSTDLNEYLQPISPDQEISMQEMQKELDAIWISGKRRSTEMNPEFRTKYALAATYRTLARQRKRKDHSGVEQYVLLSSGIVSNFIELCKYAFYFALSDGLSLNESSRIPQYLQTEAAYRVSQRSLDTIDGNVPYVGMLLTQLVKDLGAILRARLLNHSSEPEANRLSVSDFAKLEEDGYDLLAQTLDGGITWSVLHQEAASDSFRPKSASRLPSANIILNRIYCPVLGISPRSRWRVNISVADLKGLIDQSTRQSTFQRLIRTIGSETVSDQGTIFSEENLSA